MDPVEIHPANDNETKGEHSNTASSLAASPNLQLAARRVNIGDVVTPSQQSRLIADAEIGQQLGMMRESIDPSHYGGNVFTARSNIEDILDVDRNMATQSAELEFRRNTFWKSCCSSVIDRRATVFFTQVAIGIIVIFFAMSKIWVSEPQDCTGDDPSVYIGLISVILGWFVPAPSMK